MLKRAYLLPLLFLMSSCCRVFGICTSVHVHTSISPFRSFADAAPCPTNPWLATEATSIMDRQAAPFCNSRPWLAREESRIFLSGARPPGMACDTWPSRG
jgi:hypothetical protein